MRKYLGPLMIAALIVLSLSEPALAATTANLSAQDTYSGAVQVPRGERLALSISGNWAGALSLQRSVDGATWLDVDTFSSNAGLLVTVPEPEFNAYWRIGFRAGAYTSGTAEVRLAY